jgi:hypothetical protein
VAKDFVVSRQLANPCIAYFDDSGGLAAPDPALSSVLGSHGYNFFTNESRVKPSFSISHRHRNTSAKQLDSWKVPIRNRMLAVLESRVNEPFPFSRTASTRYGRIIFASHCHNSQTRELFGLPWNAPDIDVDTSRLPRIVIIQANKFSSISGECYSLRRRVIRDSVAESLPLDVYGADWKKSFHSESNLCREI